MTSLNTSNEKIKFIGELQQNCGLVENAIDHLMKCKKHVDENAVEVKCQINGNATSALDALRKREVQLLRQVDVTQAQHLDLLQAHYAKLHQLLGNLKQSLHCAEVGKHDGPQNINQEDLELARAVQQQKIIPNSISYVDDAQQLIARIESFGKISAYYNFLSSQHKEDLVSRCLPSNQEEYGDIEHQLLYKTLEEIMGEGDESKVSGEFDTPSCQTDGWLKNYSVPPKSSSCSPKSTFVLPEYLLVKEQSYWLKVGSQSAEVASPTSGKVRHVQDWLRQLTQQDTFDNVEYRTNLANSLCNKEAVPTEISESIEMISTSDSSDASGFTFVNGPPACGANNQMSWLRTVATKEQLKQERCHCSSRENGNIDIEDMWLTKHNSVNSCKNVLSTVSSEVSFDMADVCCANELCKTMRDCVCKDRCAEKAALHKLLGSFSADAATVVADHSLAQDCDWIRRALDETMLVDENPKWLSYDIYGSNSDDEKVELSEKNLKLGGFAEWSTSFVFGSNDELGGNSLLVSNSDWLSVTAHLHQSPMDDSCVCPDFVRDDFKVFFQMGLSNWLSSPQNSSPQNSGDFIRDDFKMYFQKDLSDYWVQPL